MVDISRLIDVSLSKKSSDQSLLKKQMRDESTFHSLSFILSYTLWYGAEAWENEQVANEIMT